MNIGQQYFVFKHHENKSTKRHTRTKHTKTSKTQTKEIVLSHNINLFFMMPCTSFFLLNNTSLSLTRCLEYYRENDLRTSQSHCFKNT